MERRTAHSAAMANITAPIRSLRGALRQILDTWQERRRRSDARSELSRLDPRTLRDLGLHHSEIASVVAELAGAAKPTRTHALAPR